MHRQKQLEMAGFDQAYLGPGRCKEQVLHRNAKRFRGGPMFKAHRWSYHSTLGLRVIKKKKVRPGLSWSWKVPGRQCSV